MEKCNNKILSKNDIKRNNIVCIMLALSLFVVPHRQNLGVKILLAMILIMVVINSIMIISKLVSHYKKQSNI